MRGNACGIIQFRKPEIFKRHLLIHTGEISQTCDTCGEKFTHAVSFKEHLRIRTGEEPQACNVCGKKLTQAGDLKRHVAVMLERNHTHVISLHRKK